MILLDCDGVLADFTGKMCKRLSYRGFVYSPEDFTTFDIHQHITPLAHNHFEDLYRSKGFCESIPWYYGAKEFVGRLSENVLCVTSAGPGPTWHKERLDWLRDYISPNKVIFCSSEHKKYICGDVLIEDRWETAVEWAEYQDQKTAIVVDRPWNRGKVHDRILRVYSFDEVLSYLKARGLCGA